VKAVIQRVLQARVVIASAEHSRIGAGLLVLLGVEQGDTAEDAAALAKKITELRIFEDEAGKMNRSLRDIGGELLAVSQFTLLGDCRKGRRPSFDAAAQPETARQLYERFVDEVRGQAVPVATGVFQANMNVELTNQGPVTFVLDTKRN
jgi:D-tyrosyl-tRNA(Tyr) deacylase